MRRVLPVLVSALLTAGLLTTAQPAGAQPPADPTASTFTSVSPVRVLDTRNGPGPVSSGGTTTLDLASRVPASATAVVLNLTGVTPSTATFVTVFPSGIPRPATSSLNLAPGDTRPIQVTVALGANRALNLYNNSGSTHLVADLTGYYSTGTGAKFTALAPNRLLDTRATGGPLGPGGTRVLDLVNRIPASATAVTFNLTGTAPTAATFVTAFPTGTALPNASNLNLPAGDTRANLVTVAVGADRKVTLFNNAGATHLIADLTGFHTPDYGAKFIPLAPSRVLDTRSGLGTDGVPAPALPGHIVPLDLSGAGLPATSTGVVVNVTGVDASAPTFVTAWGLYENRPQASTLNLSAAQTVPNAAAVAFGRTRGVQLFNNAGVVHLVADLAGVFAVDEAECTADCAYAWGDNVSRKLGTGHAVFDVGTPAQVAGLSGVRSVVGGGPANGYALLTGGTVRAWGNNDHGQLGNGWTSNLTGGGSPVAVPVVGLSGITEIAAGGANAVALRDDGTVWAWGNGARGRLGNGGTADSSVPVRVSGLTNVVHVATSGNNGYAVRADGTAWAWGENETTGGLGNGSSVPFSAVPVQVSGVTNATDVAAAGNNGYTHRADGAVFAWGVNSAGQLGRGTITPSISRVPVQVPGLTDTIAIAAGQYNGYAVRDDGTVWAWGVGNNGALGNSGIDCGQVEFPCVAGPVQVTGLTDATDVASFDYGAYALRENDTLVAWGFNGSQSLGNAAAGGQSPVPVAVGGAAGVSAVAGGEYAGFAVVPDPE